MLEAILYQDYDPQDELETACEKVISIAYNILGKQESDLEDILAGACAYFKSLVYRDDEENDDTTDLYRGEEAERIYREFYVKFYVRAFKGRTEDDAHEALTTWDVPWENCFFTDGQLAIIAKAVVQHDKAFMNEIARLHKEGII